MAILGERGRSSKADPSVRVKTDGRQQKPKSVVLWKMTVHFNFLIVCREWEIVKLMRYNC